MHVIPLSGAPGAPVKPGGAPSILSVDAGGKPPTKAGALSVQMERAIANDPKTVNEAITASIVPFIVNLILDLPSLLPFLLENCEE
jgi:hypothetical protein